MTPGDPCRVLLVGPLPPPAGGMAMQRASFGICCALKDWPWNWCR